MKRKKLKKYVCLYETLDWDGDKSKLRRDRAFLKSIPGLTFQKYEIEDGDPMQGYGAGILVRVPIDIYEEASNLCRSHQKEQLGEDDWLSRYGLAIVDEI